MVVRRGRDGPGERPRRLDDHPAARPGAAAARGRRWSPAPTSTCARPRRSSSPPGSRGVPRPDRQAADHHRLPEPDLLRPRRVRDRRGRPGLLRRQGPREADARPGRAARRAPAVAVGARPVSLRPQEQGNGKLVVPADSPPVVRRNWILGNLSTGRWTHLGAQELRAALAEPVILRGDQPDVWRAPHFRWQVRGQLEAILGSAETSKPAATGSSPRSTGGPGARRADGGGGASSPQPQRPRGGRIARPAQDPSRRTAAGSGPCAARTSTTRRSSRSTTAPATSARMSARRLLPRRPRSRRFNPKFDAAGVGTRQPGSAFKPILYATAFERRKPDPGLAPPRHHDRVRAAAALGAKDADQLERGPVLVRNALQMSLNIPAIRALERTGNDAVAEQAAKLGIRFRAARRPSARPGSRAPSGRSRCGRWISSSAFGTLANGGVHIPPRMILRDRGRAGNDVWKAPESTRPDAGDLASRAYLVTDILNGNTDPTREPHLGQGPELRNGPGGTRRPAAVKTGTANDARDLATYGYLARPGPSSRPGRSACGWATATTRPRGARHPPSR